MLAPQHTMPFYPESDGKPMETDLHRNLIYKMIDLLHQAFPQSYASGDIGLYYEEGNPKKVISPDVLLCRSQLPQEKRVYKAWEDHAQVDLAGEISSFSTKREDHHKKKKIYETILKVPYYFIFDPLVVYLTVFELIDKAYHQLEADIKGHYHLSGLGIQIAIENANSLRIFDTHSVPVLSIAEKEAQRAEQALREVERLKALLEQANIPQK